MSLVAALFGVFVLWLSGALLLGLAGIRDTRTAAGIGTDFAAGAALLAFLGSTSVALGIHLSLLTLYLPLLVLGCAAWVRRPDLRVCLRLPADRTARVLLLLSGFVLLVLLTGALRDRLTWDGWAIWAFKARVLFVSGTLPPAFMDRGGIYTGTVLDYPLAVPLLDWWLYSHAGIDDPALASFAGAVWLSLLALLVWGGLSERVSPRFAAGATLGILLFWPLSSYAVGGTAEVVVALVLVGSILELHRVMRLREPAAIGRLTAYLSLAVLTKNEGLTIALLAVVIAMLGLWFTRQLSVRRLLPLGLPFVLFLPWFLFTRIGLGLASVAVSDTAEAWAIPVRAYLVASATWTLFVQQPAWMPILPLVVLGIAAAVWRRSAVNLAGWFLLLAYIGAVVLVFVRTGADIVWLLMTAHARVLAATVPAAVFLALTSTVGSEADGQPRCECGVDGAKLGSSAATAMRRNWLTYRLRPGRLP